MFNIFVIKRQERFGNLLSGKENMCKFLYSNIQITYTGVDSVHFQPGQKAFGVDEAQLTG